MKMSGQRNMQKNMDKKECTNMNCLYWKICEGER